MPDNEETALVESDSEGSSSGGEETAAPAAAGKDGALSLLKDAAGGKGNEEAMASLLKDPNVMAALEGRLSEIVGRSSGYIQSLPPPVKRRIKSLKKLQLESTKLEAEFYKEVHELECKYQNMYKPLYDQRTKIITGAHEPTDVECDYPSDSEDEEDVLSSEVKDKATIEDEKKDQSKEVKAEDVKGIPSFWLTVFKNVGMLAGMVEEADEPILEKLEDVTVTLRSKPTLGFTIHFLFQENEYFTNRELTKDYEMKCALPEEDPLKFEGPEIVKCKGCTIDWNKGKNLTMKTVQKKQKHKNKQKVRTITKQVKVDSFFNFFDPPAVPDDPNEEVDEETEDLLRADFEIGHYINESIVPRAVLYFTGEALESEDDPNEDGSEDDYSDEDEDEDGSDNDPDFDPKKVKETPECHQQ